MFIRINSYNGNKKPYMDKAPDMIINLDGIFIVEQTEEKRQAQYFGITLNYKTHSKYLEFTSREERNRIFEQINDVLIPSIDTLIIK